MTTTKSPGDAGLVDSLSESMSFVVTEDIINALDEAASSENTMSRSQFAQVIFQGVTDAFSDKDLTCLFTLAGILSCAENDKVGLFKLSTLSVNDHVACKNVSEENDDQNLKTLKVVFESSTLPSDGDFYQFRYLRGDQVFGASIPFQLKPPVAFTTIERDEFLMVEQEEDIISSGSMESKVEILTAQNLELQTQLSEASSKLASLLEKANDSHAKVTSDPDDPPVQEDCGDGFKEEAEGESPPSDFSIVQPVSVTFDAQNESNLEVEPSSLNSHGPQNVKITFQLSTDVKEALMQTEEGLRLMATQNKEIVEQHKQFHDSLTMFTRSTLELCDKVEKMSAEKVVEKECQKNLPDKTDELKKLNDAIEEKDEEIRKWKTNFLHLKKIVETERDVSELDKEEGKYSLILAEYTTTELMALGDLMFSEASINGSSLHELNDKIAGLKREFLQVRERHETELNYIRNKLQNLRLYNSKALALQQTVTNERPVFPMTGAIPKSAFTPPVPERQHLQVNPDQAPPLVPPRRGREGSVAIEVEERPAFHENPSFPRNSNLDVEENKSREKLAENKITSATTSSVTLTDFGVPVARQPDPLLCPFCQREFRPDMVEDLHVHVEAHLEPNCQCPVCGKIIVIDRITKSRAEYEQHVLSHFPDDTNRDSIHDWFMNFE